MCNIIKNDVWNQLGFNQLISFYTVLNNLTRAVSSSVYKRLLLNSIKTKVPKDVVCIWKKKKKGKKKKERKKV